MKYIDWDAIFLMFIVFALVIFPVWMMMIDEREKASREHEIHKLEIIQQMDSLQLQALPCLNIVN